MRSCPNPILSLFSQTPFSECLLKMLVLSEPFCPQGQSIGGSKHGTKFDAKTKLGSEPKIIFVSALPLNPAQLCSNLGQIWEVKVRNCRQPQNCRLEGGVAVVKMIFFAQRWCRCQRGDGGDHTQVLKAKYLLSVRTLSCKLEFHFFCFCPIAIRHSLPLSPDVWLFIPPRVRERWRSVFQWVAWGNPCPMGGMRCSTSNPCPLCHLLSPCF